MTYLIIEEVQPLELKQQLNGRGKLDKTEKQLKQVANKNKQRGADANFGARGWNRDGLRSALGLFN